MAQPQYEYTSYSAINGTEADVSTLRNADNREDKFLSSISITRPRQANTIELEAGQSADFQYELSIGRLNIEEDDTDVNATVELVTIDPYQRGLFVVDQASTTATERDTVRGGFTHQFRSSESLQGKFININKRVDNGFLLQDTDELLKRSNDDSQSLETSLDEAERHWEAYLVHLNRVLKDKEDYRITPVAVRARLSYEATGDETVIYSRQITARVTPQPDETAEEIVAEGADETAFQPRGADTLGPSVADAVEFRLSNVAYPENYTGATPGSPAQGAITFDYARPAVSVDSKARYATHEIIGDTTVRQKIGEEPLQINVSGVCSEATVTTLHALREATAGDLTAPQLPTTSSLRVQFASVTTEPLEDGGAARFTDGEYLYSYEITAVEIDPEVSASE